MSYEMNLMDARDEGIAEGKAEGLKKGLKRGLKQGLSEGIQGATQLLSSYEPDNEKAVRQLMDKFNLSYQQAEEYFNA